MYLQETHVAAPYHAHVYKKSIALTHNDMYTIINTKTVFLCSFFRRHQGKHDSEISHFFNFRVGFSARRRAAKFVVNIFLKNYCSRRVYLSNKKIIIKNGCLRRKLWCDEMSCFSGKKPLTNWDT